MIPKRRNSMLRFFAAALAIAACAAHAQPYPSKPIRIIVPFTPGSATDTMARPVADKLATALGQPVVVENRPGAGGTIGIAALAKSPADGYTLAVVSTGHVVNPVLYAGLPYDTINDVSGVAPIAGQPCVLVVSPQLGVKSVKELVAMAKAKPGQLNYATAGTGSAAHICAEKFRVAAGIDAVHVPLKGSPESLTETMGGRTQYTWTPLSTAVGQIKDGRLLALAVSPREVLNRINAEVQKALAAPDMKERLANLGSDPMFMSPAEFDAFLKEEYTVLGEVMRAAGVKA